MTDETQTCRTCGGSIEGLSLDVERLTEAIREVVPYPSTWRTDSRHTWARHYAEGILARLSPSSGESKSWMERGTNAMNETDERASSSGKSGSSGEDR